MQLCTVIRLHWLGCAAIYRYVSTYLCFYKCSFIYQKRWIRPSGCSCSCWTAKLSICIVTQGTSSTERAVPAPTQGFLAGFPSTRPLPGLVGAHTTTVEKCSVRVVLLTTTSNDRQNVQPALDFFACTRVEGPEAELQPQMGSTRRQQPTSDT